MKYPLTLFVLSLTVLGNAQFPYNPDSNNNGIIGAEDLLTFLPLFGEEFSPPSPPVYQVFSGNIGYLQQCHSLFTGSDTCFIHDFTTDIELGDSQILVISDERYWNNQDLKVWGDYGFYELVVHHDYEWGEYFDMIGFGGMNLPFVNIWLSGPGGNLHKVYGF